MEERDVSRETPRSLHPKESIVPLRPGSFLFPPIRLEDVQQMYSKHVISESEAPQKARRKKTHFESYSSGIFHPTSTNVLCTSLTKARYIIIMLCLDSFVTNKCKTELGVALRNGRGCELFQENFHEKLPAHFFCERTLTGEIFGSIFSVRCYLVVYNSESGKVKVKRN